MLIKIEFETINSNGYIMVNPEYLETEKIRLIDLGYRITKIV